MHIVESTIEKLAWYLVVVLLIGECVIGFYAWQDGQKINQQQKTIIQNQDIGNQSVKDYIHCILLTNPQQPQPQIQQYLNNCFKAVPQVKK